MNLFAAIPDGYFEPSRYGEQMEALSQPTQFSLKQLFIVMTIIGCTLGAVRGIAQLVQDPTVTAQKK